ncbi:MAG TPA: 4-(cytidine 5'-diphospho)-2-C-methyl-D-erythritol kinase [Micavibrio sp.]
MDTGRGITVFAPAKINLYFHIVGKRNDGYHDLDSLVAFADIGDSIRIEPARNFHFQVDGPFAGAFTNRDLDPSLSSSNLVTRATRAIAEAFRREPHIRITLTKNLPIASGLGGGSADAAATLWGLMQLWQIPPSMPLLPELMLSLGADVPVCMHGAPVRMRGIGDILDPVPGLLDIPAILINPLKPCVTADIFRRLKGPVRREVAMPQDLSSEASLIEFLQQQNNDLTAAATECVPEVAEIISLLREQKECSLSRMSGSGATVFGLFSCWDHALKAAEQINANHPEWWVRAGTINRPER